MRNPRSGNPLYTVATASLADVPWSGKADITKSDGHCPARQSCVGWWWLENALTLDVRGVDQVSASLGSILAWALKTRGGCFTSLRHVDPVLPVLPARPVWGLFPEVLESLWAGMSCPLSPNELWGSRSGLQGVVCPHCGIVTCRRPLTHAL